MIRFLVRLSGALALLSYAYEDVEADRGAFPQALAVVFLSSGATGVAYWGDFGVRGAVAGGVLALLGWLLWTWLIYHIGARWFPEKSTRSDWGELLRTTGFATAPGIVRVFAVIPEMRTSVLLVTAVWMFVAFVLAVRQALDYEKTGHALWVCLLGWLLSAALLFVVPEACELSGGG